MSFNRLIYRIFPLLLFCIFVIRAVEEIPEKFLGEWKLERTENMNAYMLERGREFKGESSFGIFSVF